MNNMINNDIALTAAYLASNIVYVINRLDDEQGNTSFSRIGNTITTFVLPRFHKGLKVNNHISLDTTLHDITLIKMMLSQSRRIIDYVHEKDPRFAEWISGILIRFIREAAENLIKMRSYPVASAELAPVPERDNS